jgi:hypothetical protein
MSSCLSTHASADFMLAPLCIHEPVDYHLQRRRSAALSSRGSRSDSGGRACPESSRGERSTRSDFFSLFPTTWVRADSSRIRFG